MDNKTEECIELYSEYKNVLHKYSFYRSFITLNTDCMYIEGASLRPIFLTLTTLYVNCCTRLLHTIRIKRCITWGFSI